MVLTIAILAVTAYTSAGQDAPSSQKTVGQRQESPVDVLSDTKGFNLKPYIRQIIARVRSAWFLQIPDVARSPMTKQGHVAVEFQVAKDGQIADVKYRITSGAEKLDRAAFGAITGSNPLPHLPDEFPCERVKFRFNFYYNSHPGEFEEKKIEDQMVPCVTSKIVP